MNISGKQFRIFDANRDGFIDSKDASDILSYYPYLSILSETDISVDVTEYISN